MAQRTPYSQPTTPATPSARARSRDERTRQSNRTEPGLSVDSDELGMRFLVEATDQRNLESSEFSASDGRSITAESPTDDAIDNATFDANRDIWESTVALATEQDPLDGPLLMTNDGDDDEDEDDEAAVRTAEAPTVDLTGDVVREASLFDQVDEDREDTRVPEVLTDDVGHHAQRSVTRTKFSRRAQ